MEKEIWKEIKGYEGYFEVSNLGNFRSKNRVIGYKYPGKTRNYPGKILKVESIFEGYTRIVLMKNHIRKRYMCHRLGHKTACIEGLKKAIKANRLYHTYKFSFA